MKAAFSCLDNRIAPVFDTARQIVLVETLSKRVVQESSEVFLDDLPVQKAIYLAELRVNTLVCGAISRHLHGMVMAYGTQVAPFVTGDLKEVIRAWINNRLCDRRFIMPGCRALGRQRFHSGLSREQEVLIMNGRRGGGMGPGGGRGRNLDQTGRGRGRMGGAAAGPDGFCVCSRCGERQPHQTGVPCFEQKCSKCGATMTRETRVPG